MRLQRWLSRMSGSIYKAQEGPEDAEAQLRERWKSKPNGKA